jgi:Protein of unknown function (DUF1254)
VKRWNAPKVLSCLALVFAVWGCAKTEQATTAATGPSDAELENLVRRSYQYVAMYNVNNKGALKHGGWNTLDIDTALKDHTLRLIARPNNDTLYITGVLDLRKEPASSPMTWKSSVLSQRAAAHSESTIHSTRAGSTCTTPSWNRQT